MKKLEKLSLSCPFRGGEECVNTFELKITKQSDPRFEDLADQDFELCNTPSYQTCSIYKNLIRGKQ